MPEAPEGTAPVEQPEEAPTAIVPESRNETLPQAPEAEPAKDDKSEPEKDPTPTMSVPDYAHELDPDFITPEMQEKLDRISGITEDEGTGEYDFSRGQQESLVQGPSFDSSHTAGRLRELIYGDGEHPGLLQNRAKLLALKKPVDYERTLVKEYNNEKAQLENAFTKQYADLVALASHYFNDPAKYEGPVIQNNFQPDLNPEVTITSIIERVGMPEEAPEPEEFLNPSRIPSRSS